MSDSSRTINLALQGGGAHGAFTWGVLDRLLEDGRIAFDGIAATSAGAMNAAVLADGLMAGGRDGAREALHTFWNRISRVGSVFAPVRRMPWYGPFGTWLSDQSPSFRWFDFITRSVSPYEFNPLNLNPLRSVLESVVDFDRLRHCTATRLFLSATNVRSGLVEVFTTAEMSAEAVLASACLLFLFQAVEIDGEAYWDGGYMGNPALYPLFYETRTRDVVVVHINPISRPDVPRRAHEINDRINEISFNSSLIREMRAIAFVTKLIEEDWLKPEYRDRLRRVLVHAIADHETMRRLSVASKFESDWNFLTFLRDAGRAAARHWLDYAFDAIGVRSTVDLRAEYLGERPENPPMAKAAE